MIKILVSASAALAAIIGTAQAAAIVSFVQDGDDVIASLSGSLDLTGLIADDRDFMVGGDGILAPDIDVVAVGPNANLTYYAVTGPGDLDGMGFLFGDQATGDTVGVDFDGIATDGVPSLFVADGFMGGAVSGETVFLGVTLASLGVSGTQLFTLGNGDTLTLIFGDVAAVPLPGALAMFVPAMIGGIAARRRARR